MRAANFIERARPGIWAFVLLPIPAAAVFVWRESWWPPIVLVIWTVTAAAINITLEKRKLRAQSVRMLEHAQKSFIRTLSLHRHDWMNDLQILYGYLRLNKPDKATNIVDRIKERMEIDSRISQLGHAELSMFLLSFRAICDHLRLDVNISEGLALDRIRQGPGPFASGLISLINMVRYRSKPSGARENVLRLSMKQADGILQLEIIYEGDWVPGQSVAEAAENLFKGTGQLTDKDEDEASGSGWRILLAFPLTA